MEHREQVSQFKLEHLDSLKELNLATKSILDAIIERQDVFQVIFLSSLSTLILTLF